MVPRLKLIKGMHRNVRPRRHFDQLIVLSTLVLESQKTPITLEVARRLGPPRRLRLYVTEHSVIGGERVFNSRCIGLTFTP